MGERGPLEEMRHTLGLTMFDMLFLNKVGISDLIQYFTLRITTVVAERFSSGDEATNRELERRCPILRYGIGNPDDHLQISNTA